MLLSVILAIIAALLSSVLTTIGIYLTVYPARTKRQKKFSVGAVAVCGILTIGLTGWQAYAAAQADAEVLNGINQIERQIQQAKKQATLKGLDEFEQNIQSTLTKLQQLRDRVQSQMIRVP
jgi:L-ribulose-5-phosphate 3-epimerase UlaE